MAQQALPETTLRAQLLESFNTPYTLKSVPLPSLTQPHAVLVRVLAASYCHTDHVLASGQMPPFPPSFPHIGCHEFSGEIVSFHPDAPPSEWNVGDKVGVPGRSFHPCGKCFECSAEPTPEQPDIDGGGYSVYCSKAGNHGISAPGGFREYAVVDSRQIAPLPEKISAVEGATLMCAGLTIYGALKKVGLKKGQRVGIMGAGGGLGHLGLQFAAAMGLRVTGFDIQPGPLELARSIASGRENVTIIDSTTVKAEDVVGQLGAEDGKQDKGEMGVDAVIILPESQKAFDYGMALLKTHGKCVVVSFPEKGFHVSARDIVFRDISVVGSLVGSNKILREMLLFAAEHDVKASIKTFPLSKLNELVEEYLEAKGGKLAIDMTLADT
ncbi:chaperonin 10-like protein [Podospora australis]|uniref:Chaperonin 10-like protein n=1 Tax=Podospora australis TaxID=1536484 RepID=A0AAN6WPW8_9PEZI|nr:chaperonin 10-like protein [Podospora australis]